MRIDGYGGGRSRQLEPRPAAWRPAESHSRERLPWLEKGGCRVAQNRGGRPRRRHRVARLRRRRRDELVRSEPRADDGSTPVGSIGLSAGDQGAIRPLLQPDRPAHGWRREMAPDATAARVRGVVHNDARRGLGLLGRALNSARLLRINHQQATLGLARTWTRLALVRCSGLLRIRGRRTPRAGPGGRRGALPARQVRP